jgi:hypothetical protein
MKQWSREQIMKGLKELVPEMDCPQITEGVDGEGGGLATNGESDWIFKGLPPFNHNLEYGEILLSDNGDTDPNHKGMKVKEMYVYGIHQEIYSWLEERGWYPEWYDPGTLFFWKCTEDWKETMLERLEDFQMYHDLRKNDGIEVELIKKLKEQAREWGYD